MKNGQDLQQLFLQKISEKAMTVVKNLMFNSSANNNLFKHQGSSQQKSDIKKQSMLFDPIFGKRSIKPAQDSTELTIQCKNQTQDYLNSFLLDGKNKLRRSYKKKRILESQTNFHISDKSQRQKKLKQINIEKLEGSGIDLIKLKKKQISLPPVKRQEIQHSLAINNSSSPGVNFTLNNNSDLKFSNQLKSKTQKFITINQENHKSTNRNYHKRKSYSLFLNNQIVNKSFFQQSQSLKTIQYVLPKKLEKGYMFYDQSAAQFFKFHKHNLQLIEKATINLNITAKYYIALNIDNLKCIFSRNKQTSIEIASLTKIMTCYLCILACIKYEVNIKTYIVRISDKVIQVPGTSAQLEPGDLFTIEQLLYGLMLPSGNDSSLIIAETIGKIIQRHKKKPTKKTPYETFISHMNLLAKQLSLEQVYQNSSGLSLNPNFSTPISLATLTSIALRNHLFRTIISTKQYSVDIKNDRFGLVRKINWKNTNRLLWKGWEGVKTGTTQSAGHCLASLKGNYLICVFDCQSLGKRFSQCCKILQEIQKRNENRN